MAKQHTVAQGDTLVTIAHANGLRSWEPIWNHEENDELRKKRDPFVLAPGDTVAIPDKAPREQTVDTGKKHAFRLKSLKAQVHLVLHDEDDQPYANRAFTLAAGDKTVKGATDGEGVLNAFVPVDAKTATLQLFAKEGVDPLEWELQLGQLDPVDTDSGVVERLRNLGYDLGEAKALSDEPVKKALRAFQGEHQLPATGEADPKTRALLGKSSTDR